MNQTKEWHILKILLVSLIPFIGGWLFLQFLFEAFAIHLSAGFISTFLFVHAVIAITIYEIFRILLRGKLTLSAIKLRFNKSLCIAFASNVVVLSLLSMIFRFDSIILLSPVFLNLILFLSLRSNIPAGIKRRIKFRTQPMAENFSMPDETKEPVVTSPSLALADPLGLTSPISPHYVNRFDKQ